jgi:hypothetical protein
MMKVPVLLIPLVLTTTLAAAQSKGYVQAGALATEQPAATPNHRVLPGLGGNTVGVAAAVGFFVAPTVAIEGEVVAGRAISTQQRFSYNWFEDYTAQSRDVFLGVNVRWRPVAGGPLELVGGGGPVFSTDAQRSIVVTDLPGAPVPRPSTEPDQVETSALFAINGGIAAPFAVSRRIELVPAFTVRWVGRSVNGLGGYAGVGRRAYQVGAAVRWTFD